MLLRPRYAQHVEIRREVVLRESEGLPYQSLDPIAFDATADSSGDADTQPAGIESIPGDVDDQVGVGGAAAGCEQAFEVSAPLETLGASQRTTSLLPALLGGTAWAVGGASLCRYVR